MLLVGDVGGTKTHLALFEGMKCVREERYFSREFPSLKEIVRNFNPGPVEKACFGVAGPVENNRCHATNLPWVIDAKDFDIKKVWLINDLVATAWGIGSLKSEELVTLNDGQPRKGHRAILAAGTGLGIAGIFWDGKEHHPFPSEGGHVDFAPRDETEKLLWLYLKKKYGHVSYERVISGPGLEHLYWFYLESGRTHEKLGEEDLPVIITHKAVQGESKACREIVEWFCCLYGSVAGNIALQFMASGGVYVGGGIAPKIISILKEGFFMRGFSEKGRFHDLLSSIPVHVIMNENTALLGAAVFVNRQ
ncbi:MAG: glucokinase [Verrucomicrobia bacterium]|nr:glucokinase [Verrucomicrobiota bacterium]